MNKVITMKPILKEQFYINHLYGFYKSHRIPCFGIDEEDDENCDFILISLTIAHLTIFFAVSLLSMEYSYFKWKSKEEIMINKTE